MTNQITINGIVRDETPEEEAERLALFASIVVDTSYRIPKTLPWMRMSTEEAELVAGAMIQTDARLRAIYDAAQYLDSGDPLWPVLHEMLAGVLSPERADELLAPETSE